MGQNNVIELNGKKYDALSGAFLGESRIKATPASRTHMSQRGRAIDGFIKNKVPAQAPTVIKPTKPKVAPAKAHAAKKAAGKNFDIQRGPKTTIKPHQPERPKTLMRHVVQKPKTALKPAIKTTAPSEVMARPKSTIAKPLEKKLSVSQVNPVRLARSRHVSKSHHIKRFEKGRQPATHQVAAVNQAARAAQYVPRPAAARPVQRSQAPQAIVQTQATATAPAQHDQSASDIFEAALAHATSHEQTTPKHARYRSSKQRRLVNILAGVGAFLLIGGFTAYMNMTNLEMRVASMRAGFHAQMPSYQPAGYALDGGIESSEGKVAMNFRSGDSLFTVTQEASDWNSSTLLDQTASEHGEPTQAIQSKGRTIYIYNDSNATWVNGGVRYEVTGNAALDADELVSLATSM